MTVELFTFAATRGQLQFYAGRSLKALALDATVIDNENPSIANVTDIDAAEVSGGTYARTAVTGAEWDLSGTAPAVRADDLTIAGLVVTDPDVVGAVVVFDDATGALVWGIRFDPISVTGDLPIQWGSGTVATITRTADAHPAQADHADEFLSTDGTQMVWRRVTDPAALRPLTASGATTNAGRDLLLGFGLDPTPYEGQPLAAETIPANGWDGLRVMGQMRSTVGSSFPSAGFHLTALVYFGRRTYSVAGEWIEALTVHSYTLGDTNELHDWLEIAAVHDDPDLDTLRGGCDLRLNGETIEYTFVTTGRPFRFNTWQMLDVTLDPTTAEMTWTVDGGTPETGVPARVDDPMDTPTLPCTLSTPDTGADILVARGATVVGEITLAEFGDPPATLIDPADGTDGALSFTSGARPWVSWGGRVAAPLRSRTLIAGPWSLDSASLDIGAGDSYTWLLNGIRFSDWDYAAIGGSAIHWGRNPAATSPFGPGGAGWAFLSVPGFGLPLGFAITSAGYAGSVTVGGPLPDGPCTVAVVLDRDTDELRLYVATPAGGTVLVDTADASGLGAVSPAATGDLFSGVGGELYGWHPTHRRALTQTEISFLALSAPAA